MKSSQLSQQIQQDANQCVKCGLCLPYCPTYQLTQNECESCRGRIALMDGLVSKKLPLTDKLKTYLDHCLTCQLCEKVCPAQVPYGRLIDNTRTLLNSLTKNSLDLPKILDLALRHPSVMKAIASFLYFYQKTKLQQLIRKTKLLKLFGLARADSLLPPLTKNNTLQTYYPPQTTEQGQVALFIGCINPWLDFSTITAAIKVLTYYGYGVHVPRAQRCCGALHLHAGQPDRAAALAKQNLKVFDSFKNLQAIITLASGCGSVLANNPFAIPVIDINQFIVQAKPNNRITIEPLTQLVFVHTPCTLQNGPKPNNVLLELLNKIPAVKLQQPSFISCCGAAGLYMLNFPNISDQLLAKLITEIDLLKPDYFVTANIGCQLHFYKALTNKGYKMSILHPIALLAQQMTLNN